MAQLQPLDMNELKRRMDGAIATLRQEYAGLRTGRASASLLDPVVADAYGQTMKVTELATVNVPEPRLITLTVWDKGTVAAVDKAIRNAGIGLNPQVDGTLIRIPIPPLNEERRKELSKLAGKYAEAARVAVRNVRRDGMDHLKRLEKDHVIGEDVHKKQSDEVQKMTDAEIKEIDTALANKEKEIMQV
jgi:ribosome recycling factor